MTQLIAADGSPWDRRDLKAPDMTSPAGLLDIARCAKGVGVEKSLVIPRDAEGRLLLPTDLAERAHELNLLVHAWTFRAENYFLPADMRRGDPTLKTISACTGT